MLIVNTVATQYKHFGAFPSSTAWCVHKHQSRTMAPLSISSSIWLSAALTSCLPALALPLWPPLTSSVWSDRQRCALLIKRCGHLSVCHCAQMHLHMRTTVPVTLADVHRQRKFLSSACHPQVSPIRLCLEPVEQPSMPSLHHNNGLCPVVLSVLYVQHI